LKNSEPADHTVFLHALHLGDRINTAGFEGSTLSSAPLAIRTSETGIAVLFRYGVHVVLIGMAHQQEADFLDTIVARVSGKEEETASV
jgi:hypothetical protein